MAEASTFVWADWLVFGLILLISAGIGLYHAFTGGRQRSTKELLTASSSMHALPVALSVLASFFSASTLLGTPAEIYQQGIMYWISVFGAIFAPLCGATIFGPFFYKLKMVSIFEYLEKRFESKSVRLLGAILYIVRLVIGMGIVLFGPSVALAAVSTFPVWAGIVVVGAVCCFYTALGGMKAVIWTDTFQTCIMLAGMLAAIIQGSIVVGGISRAWEIFIESGRGQFFDFNPSPLVRHTFWTLMIGNFIQWLLPYTVDQQMMQRFASTKSIKQSKIALYLNIPGMFIIITLCCMAGFIMFAYYADCDPRKTGVVSDPNQLLPRFVLDVLSFAPGIPGLFVASLFSGCLSSISSMLNSAAAVAWEDFFKFGTLGAWARKQTDAAATRYNKLLAVLFAILGIAMAFVFSGVGGTVLQMSIAFNGSAGAPLLGLFFLGMFFPWTNWLGAFVGGIVGFAMPMWISVGSYATKPPVMRPMNFSTCGCPLEAVTEIPQTTPSLEDCIHQDYLPPDQPISGVEKLYMLSYMWYTAVGLLVTIFVGLVVSFATRSIYPPHPNPKHMVSYVDIFWPCCPESCKRPCRCGVNYEQEETDETLKDIDEGSVIEISVAMQSNNKSELVVDASDEVKPSLSGAELSYQNENHRNNNWAYVQSGGSIYTKL